MTEQIGISPKFFETERDRMYDDWPVKFWRELIQNSVDAGSTTVTITLSDARDADGARLTCPRGYPICRVTFADNGTGMDEETIRTVYMVLGESSKNRGDSIGGFGRARILTNFGQHRYRIDTRTCRVEGSGSAFLITRLDSPVKGCVQEIDVKGADLATMRHALERYLSLCQLDVRVLIRDGETGEVQPWGKWAYRRARTNELVARGEAFADVHLVKDTDQHAGLLIVRVNGVAMFEMPHAARGRVIVEIHPEKASPREHKILTLSRDSLHWPYSDALYKLLDRLAIDKNSGLRENKRQNFVIKGDESTSGIFAVAVSPQKSVKPRNKQEKLVAEGASLSVGSYDARQADLPSEPVIAAVQPPAVDAAPREADRDERYPEQSEIGSRDRNGAAQGQAVGDPRVRDISVPVLDAPAPREIARGDAEYSGTQDGVSPEGLRDAQGGTREGAREPAGQSIPVGTSWAGAEVIGRDQDLATAPTRGSDTVSGSAPPGSQKPAKAPLPANSALPFDLFINADNPNPKVRRAMARFDPRKWSAPGEHHGGGAAARVLTCWNIAIHHCAQAMLRAVGGGTLRYGIGLNFGGAAEALHHVTEDGAHVYFINPVDDAGRLAYRTSDRMDRKRMIADAKHEMAHTLCRYHDEDYAALLTMIDACLDERDVYRDMDRGLEKLRAHEVRLRRKSSRARLSR